MKILRYLVLFAMLTFMAACGGGGGGGGGTPAKTVTLKVSTVDDPLAISSATGVNVTITLPAGVTAGANAVTVTGVAAPGTLVGSPVYTPASGATQATLQFVMATSIPAGFNVGEFATVVLSYSGAVALTTTDFPVSTYTIINENLSGTSVVTGAKVAATGVTVL
jgi:hypothetical protein